MDGRNQLRACEDEEIDVVLDQGTVVAETRPSDRRFVQLVLLDHRAHRSVEDEDAFREKAAQLD